MSKTGFSLADWDSVQVFHGRLATQADVEKGEAVFSLSDTVNGQAFEEPLPQPCVWYEDDDEFPALIVQAEQHETEDGEMLQVLGLLMPDGETAVAFAEDVDEVSADDPFWQALVEAFDPANGLDADDLNGDDEEDEDDEYEGDEVEDEDEDEDEFDDEDDEFHDDEPKDKK
jgi:hypothetical protein